MAQQGGVIVRYDGFAVDEYTTDSPVEGSVLVELKAVNALDTAHGNQTRCSRDLRHPTYLRSLRFLQLRFFFALAPRGPQHRAAKAPMPAPPLRTGSHYSWASPSL